MDPTLPENGVVMTPGPSFHMITATEYDVLRVWHTTSKCMIYGRQSVVDDNAVHCAQCSYIAVEAANTSSAEKLSPNDLEVLSCCDEAHCSMHTTSCGRELVFEAGTTEDKSPPLFTNTSITVFHQASPANSKMSVHRGKCRCLLQGTTKHSHGCRRATGTTVSIGPSTIQYNSVRSCRLDRRI